MEQMYLLEIFIDRVTVFLEEGDEGTVHKNLITKVKFGPKTQFIIKEGQLAVSKEKGEDLIEVTEIGRRQWSRTVRVGKSLLFSSYPDTVLTILNKFPLEIEVWDDDETELPNKIYVGIGTMYWHTRFYQYLKEASDPCKIHESLAIKEIITLYQECCCVQAGEISIILRLSALGASIVTEFQQLMDDPDRFCFRTDKAPSMFECKRVEGDDPNFCMTGSIYETTTLEDPDVLQNAQKRIEICTELQSCGIGGKPSEYVCRQGADGRPKKKYAINKIRMGDITGPCGNTNCPLAHKVRMYIRHLDSYKAKAGGIASTKSAGTKKICGTCGCKDDRWHREDCPEREKQGKTEKVKCSGCGGMARPGETCEDKKNKHFGTGTTPSPTPHPTPKPTPKGSKTQVTGYVTKVPTYKDAIFKRDYIVEDCYSMTYLSQDDMHCKMGTSKDVDVEENAQTGCGCAYHRSMPSSSKPAQAASKSATRNMATNDQWVYNAEVQKTQKVQTVYNVCTEIPEDKDCKCSPIKPSPPCKTFDCTCIPELRNIASRKAHRPYCPLYTHKTNCPVTMMHEEEGVEKKEEDEDEMEPLPYGLPPIRLGPCPVLGRPCSVPDGFARMYRNAVLPTQPPSYSNAGKICCSKEYDRIKKAVKEYMKYQKDHDMRCINKYNVDTERRCCDKEQALLALMGRDCCGTHKLAIQQKYKDQKKDKQ